MTFPLCPDCAAELGPWEGARCLKHGPSRPYTIADQAVLVLENESAPLYLYDLQRGIEREVGRRANGLSVSSVVGADRRFCWSGKGMYALFRHGRIPWVRTLADVATFILVAAGRPLGQEELRFLMKWQGYRFQDISLDGALGREGRFVFGWEAATPGSPVGWKVALRDQVAQRERFDALAQPIQPDVRDWLESLFAVDQSSVSAVGPQPTPWPVEDLITRWRDTVRVGLHERLRRLGERDGDNAEVSGGS